MTDDLTVSSGPIVTDNLTARIAAVSREHKFRYPSARFPQCCTCGGGIGENFDRHIAEQIVKELGLEDVDRIHPLDAEQIADGGFDRLSRYQGTPGVVQPDRGSRR